jgi:hypothetical protein
VFIWGCAAVAPHALGAAISAAKATATVGRVRVKNRWIVFLMVVLVGGLVGWLVRLLLDWLVVVLCCVEKGLRLWLEWRVGV